MKKPVAAAYELVADKVGRRVASRRSYHGPRGHEMFVGHRVEVVRPDGSRVSMPASQFDREVRAAFPKDRNLENPELAVGSMVHVSLPAVGGAEYPWFAVVESVRRESVAVRPLPFVNVADGKNIMREDIVERDGSWCSAVSITSEQVAAISEWLQRGNGPDGEALLAKTGLTWSKLEALVGYPY